jgi:carboxymethylenebutenolidase
MTSRNDNIDAGHGQHFGSYVSVPAQPNGHAVIVLQEIFGVTPHIRAVADRFAADGYLAYAPDLFWRFAPNISLTHSKEDIAKAMGYLHDYPDSDGLRDIASTAQHIRALPGFAGEWRWLGCAWVASWRTWLRPVKRWMLRSRFTAWALKPSCNSPPICAAP